MATTKHRQRAETALLARALELDRAGLSVPEQAAELGMKDDTYRRWMRRRGFQRQVLQALWVPSPQPGAVQ